MLCSEYTAFAIDRSAIVETGEFDLEGLFIRLTAMFDRVGAKRMVLDSAEALFAGLPLPLLPVQLLWLNLVTNGIQDVALAFERGQRDELQSPPRRHNLGQYQLVDESGVVALRPSRQP